MSLNSVLKIYFFVFLMTLATVAEAGRHALPEVGKRIYVIEKESSKPVIVTNEGAAVSKSQVILRDPSLTFSDRPVPRVEKKRVVASVKRPIKRNGRMTFLPVKINANLRKPRVEFQEEYLKVGISEESYGADFFEKVNDPLKDSEF